MRACEGCRRRKIKCDAATTNAWPCAACVRLKLQCVPPTVNYSRAHSAGSHVSGLERVLDFDNSSGGSGDEDYPPPPMMSNVYQLGSRAELAAASQAAYTTGIGAFHASPYVEKMEGHGHMPYDSVSSLSMSVSDAPYHTQSSFHLPRSNSMPVAIQPAESTDTWRHEDISAENLSEALGELKIDETGIGKSYKTWNFGIIH